MLGIPLLAGLTVFGMLMTGPGPAHQGVLASEAAADSIQHVSPEAFRSPARSLDAGGSRRLFALDRWGATASIPETGSMPVVVSTPGASETRITLPFAQEARHVAAGAAGASAFDNGNGSTSVVIPQDDSAVEFATVITRADAPEAYTYLVDLPEGERLSSNETGGSISVLDARGAWVAGISAPWAKDSNGIALKTEFSISGNTLTQFVHHRDVPISYPVVADPWFGVALIRNVVWVSGDQWGPTAQIYPTSAGRDTIFAPAVANEAAWGEALEKGDRSRLDRNNLHDQFTCHWQVVRYDDPGKASWNLDSRRPDVGLARTIAARCNPGGGTED